MLNRGMLFCLFKFFFQFQTKTYSKQKANVPVDQSVIVLFFYNTNNFFLLFWIVESTVFTIINE